MAPSETDDLIAALQKTARQAERAGPDHPPHPGFREEAASRRGNRRNGSFDIVEDAVELAGIELRRRKVADPDLRGAAPAHAAWWTPS